MTWGQLMASPDPRPAMASMLLSRSEIEALCAKAARGAGLDWGLAEEAARSATVLDAAGLPGPEWLLDCLETPAGAALDLADPAAAIALCPVRSGAVLLDQGARLALPITMPQVIAPGLLIGFLLRSTRRRGEGGFQLTWAQGKATVLGAGVSVAGAPPPAIGAVGLSRTHGPAGEPNPAPRRPRDAEIWRRLTVLARATTVPATADSRAGAGAGTHDND